MYLEATVDADHRIHPVGISDMISTENLIGYTGFMERNVAATGGQQSPLLGGVWRSAMATSRSRRR